MLREAEREEAGKVSISSSSWVQVGGGDKEGVQRVRVNGNQPADREGEVDRVEEEKKEDVEEPVKPPRLKMTGQAGPLSV